MNQLTRKVSRMFDLMSSQLNRNMGDWCLTMEQSREILALLRVMLVSMNLRCVTEAKSMPRPPQILVTHLDLMSSWSLSRLSSKAWPSEDCRELDWDASPDPVSSNNPMKTAETKTNYKAQRKVYRIHLLLHRTWSSFVCLESFLSNSGLNVSILILW